MANTQGNDVLGPVDFPLASFIARGRVTPSDNVYRSGVSVEILDMCGRKCGVGVTDDGGYFIVQVTNAMIIDSCNRYIVAKVGDDSSDEYSLDGNERKILPQNRIDNLKVTYNQNRDLWALVEIVQGNDDFSPLLHPTGSTTRKYVIDYYAPSSSVAEMYKLDELPPRVSVLDFIGVRPSSFILYGQTVTYDGVEYVFPDLKCVFNDEYYDVVRA